MKKQSLLLLTAAICLLAVPGCKQDAGKSQAGLLPSLPASHLDRFEMEIQAYEATDAKQLPPIGGVVFAGSSSIRLWGSLAADFSNLPAINRGFGGSTLPEVTHYAPRVIYKYQPRAVVLYCGENDMAEGAAPAVAFQSFKQFIGETEKNLPNATIVVLSAKPSPSRWQLWKSFGQYNSMVAQFVKNRPNLRYVDIGGLMLGPDGQPDPSLFTEDNLHMNASGYAKWAAALKPVLEPIFAAQPPQ